MRKLSPCERIRESSEVYVLSGRSSQSNTKIRDKVMDIKVLVREERGLEQWKPILKADFPLTAETLREEVFPAFGVRPQGLQRPGYSLELFLAEIVRPHPDLVAAAVFKRRFGFTVGGCIAEIAELLVNGAAIRTVALESEDLEAVLKAKQTLGLEEYENVNYVLALKRITGMEALADHTIPLTARPRTA
jgi:hypothetical protein